MRVARPIALALTALLLGCAGAEAARISSRSPRADVVARLCELLPPQAYECVASWPTSVPPRRRAEVMTMSVAGPLAGSDAPVRAYASCQDRGIGFAPVARVTVLLLEGTPATREELEAAVPMGFRWEDEPCEDDTCALPVARLDGDRLVLTRRDFRTEDGATDLARVVCSAVRDGAVEAYATALAQPPTLRELLLDESGVEIRTRTLGRRPTTEPRVGWVELGMRLVDDEIAREAAARAAEAARVRDVEAIDLHNEATVDVQVLARERRLRRDPAPERVAELAELLARAYAANPSRVDLGIHAVERSIEAGELDTAAETLAQLEALLGAMEEPLPRLTLSLALARGDLAAVARSAPEVDRAASARIAARLLAERGSEPIDASTGITLALARNGLVAIARRDTELRPVARAEMTLRGLPAALATALGCEADAVIACSDGLAARSVTRVVSATAGTVTLVGDGRCVAAVPSPRSVAELAHVVGPLGIPDGALELHVACGAATVALAGVVEGATLTVTRASRRALTVELAEVERWLARPFASFDGRVFPAPSLSLEAAEDEVEAVLSAARTVDRVACVRGAEGATCTSLDAAAGANALADVLAEVYASFASD